MPAKTKKTKKNSNTTNDSIPPITTLLAACSSARVNWDNAVSEEQNNNDDNTYRSKGGPEAWHGIDFELQLFALCNLNALDLKYKFYAASGVKQAAVFDDIALFYPDASKKKSYNCFLMQSKHSANPKDIEYHELKNSSGEFSLREYFKSYVHVNVWNEHDLFGPGTVKGNCIIKHVVLCSNRDLSSKLTDKYPNDICVSEDHYHILQPYCENTKFAPKFYKISESFLKTDRVIEGLAREFNQYFKRDFINEFARDFVLALNFPPLEVMDEVLTSILKKLHGGAAYVDASFRESFQHWLFNRSSRVQKPNRCQYIHQTQLLERIQQPWPDVNRAIFDILSYRFKKDYSIVLSVKQKNFPESDKQKINNFIGDERSNILCCRSPERQNIQWTTAQIYSLLRATKFIEDDDIFLIHMRSALDKFNNLSQIFQDKRLWVIVEDDNTSSSTDEFLGKMSRHSISSKIVLIVPFDREINEDCINCPHLTIADVEELMLKEIIFQRRKMKLKDFLPDIPESRWTELINSTALEKLLENDCVLDTGQFNEQNNGVNYIDNLSLHIPRRLCFQNRLDWFNLRAELHTSNLDRFVIISEDVNIRKQVTDMNTNTLILQDLKSLQEDVLVAVLDSNSINRIQESIPVLKKSVWKNCNIHTIIAIIINSKESKIEYQLHKSFEESHSTNTISSSSVIQSFISKYDDEDENFVLSFPITLLVAEPGMGKSYFIRWLLRRDTHLHKSYGHIPKFIWKIIVNLGSYNDVLRESCFESLEHIARFLVSTFACQDQNDLNWHFLCLFLRQLSNDHVVVLALDAFDEIDTVAQQKTIKLIELLKTVATIRIIITTREHSVYNLKNTFAVATYKLEPVTEAQQLNYLKTYWKETSDTNPSRAERFVQRIQDINKESKDLLSTPLLCRIVAEAYDPRIDENQMDIIKDDFVIIDVYAKFVERNFEIHTKGKLKLKESNPYTSCMYEYFIHLHQHAAFYYLQSELYKAWYQLEEPLSDEKKQILFNGGLIQSRSDQHDFNFIHQTFAEYCEATLHISVLCNSRDGDPLLRNCMQHLQYALLSDQYKVISLFIFSYYNKLDTKLSTIDKANERVHIFKRELFQQRLKSIVQNWIHEPRPYNSQREYTAKLKSPIFNARNTNDETEQQQPQIKNPTTANSNNQIREIIRELSFQLTQLFRIPTSDRRKLVDSIRKNDHHKIPKSHPTIFEINTWIAIYELVDEKKALSYSISSDDLLVKHVWLFETVFPCLFSGINDETYDSTNEDQMLKKLLYQERVMTCMADLLFSEPKDNDDKLMLMMNKLKSMNEKLESWFRHYLVRHWLTMKESKREELCKSNVFEFYEQLLVETSHPKTFSKEELKDMMREVENRNVLALEVDERLRKRKVNQKNFIHQIFSPPEDHTGPYDIDEYLCLVEKRIIQAIESKFCNGNTQYVGNYKNLCCFDPDHKMYLSLLVEKFEIFTESMSENFGKLFLFNDEQKADIMNNLLFVVEQTWLEKRVPTQINNDLATKLIINYFLIDDVDNFDWNTFYKAFIIIIQRSLDEIYRYETKIQSKTGRETLQSTCELIVLFAEKAGLVIVADLYETKLVLYKHKSQYIDGFVAEIVMNSKEQTEDTIEEIKLFINSDGYKSWY